MIIKVFWEDINIMDIIKKNKVYISNIDYDNFIKANEKGMPFAVFLNHKLISLELPDFIKKRLPTPKSISKELDRNEVTDNNISIIDYINKTKCKCATDKFEIKIEYGNRIKNS